MHDFIAAHGGPVATVVVVVGCFNVVMCSIKKLCDKLKIQEPVSLQKIGAFGSTVAEFLSANTTAGAAMKAQEQAQASQDKPLA